MHLWSNVARGLSGLSVASLSDWSTARSNQYVAIVWSPGLNICNIFLFGFEIRLKWFIHPKQATHVLCKCDHWHLPVRALL